MYGNCLTFALHDFFTNGGELVISFYHKQWIPHFAVQRDEKVYDLEIVRMFLYVFFYDGDPRIRNAEAYNHVRCKRYLVASRKISAACTSA